MLQEVTVILPDIYLEYVLDLYNDSLIFQRSVEHIISRSFDTIDAGTPYPKAKFLPDLKRMAASEKEESANNHLVFDATIHDYSYGTHA